MEMASVTRRARVVVAVLTLIALCVAGNLLGGCGGSTGGSVGSSGAAPDVPAPSIADAGAEEFGTGAELPTLDAARNLPEALDPDALEKTPGSGPAARSGVRALSSPTPLPSSFAVNYDLLTPVGQQGSSGACVAWSWGHEFGSAIHNQATPIHSQTAASQVNPLWMYAMALKAENNEACAGAGGGTNGTRPLDYVEFYEKSGAWSNATIPTFPIACSPTPSPDKNCPDAGSVCPAVATADSLMKTTPADTSFKLAAGTLVSLGIAATSPTPVPGSEDDVVVRIKKYMATQQLPVAIAIKVPYGLQATQGYKVTREIPVPVLWADYYARDKDGCKVGGHGMLIVGYDDTRVASAAPDASPTPVPPPAKGCYAGRSPDWQVGSPQGAFLIMNSWGPKYGVDYPAASPSGQKPVTAGFMWMTYDTFRHVHQMTTVDDQSVPLAFGYQPAAAATTARSAVPLMAGGLPFGSVVSAYPFARPSLTGEAPRVYAIFRVVLPQRCRLDQVSLSIPGGQTLTEAYQHDFENGYLHFSRRDGAQWPRGNYTLTLSMHGGDGTAVTATATVPLSALSVPLPEQPVGSDVRGMNGNPVTLQ